MAYCVDTDQYRLIVIDHSLLKQTHEKPLQAVTQTLQALLADRRAETSRFEQDRLPTRSLPSINRSQLPVAGAERSAVGAEPVVRVAGHGGGRAGRAAVLHVHPALGPFATGDRTKLYLGKCSRGSATRRGRDSVELTAGEIVESASKREVVGDGAGHGRD